MKEIVLDTETTGLSVKEGHRIVEIGCIELENLIPTKKIFHCYLNPERKVSKSALEVHGHTDEFLSNKKINYLEIGVSVMKNFMQIDNYLVGSNLVAYDINPVVPKYENDFKYQLKWFMQRDLSEDCFEIYNLFNYSFDFTKKKDTYVYEVGSNQN